MDDGEFWKDVIEMKGIGIWDQTESLFPFQRTDDLGDLFIFNKDIIPDGDKFFEREGKVKLFLQGFKKLEGGYLPDFITIDRPFFKIEEIREYLSWILKFLSLRESGEFFCNLVVVEGRDHIA